MRFALTAEIAEVSEIEIYPFFSVFSDNSAVYIMHSYYAILRYAYLRNYSIAQ